MSISQLIDDRELKSCIELINKHKIPSPPQKLLDLKAEISSANPNKDVILELISEDIGLSSSIIKIVNSAQFNLSTEVVSIEHAINLLGLKSLKNAIIQPAYKVAMNNSIDGFERISNHSHSVGLISELTSRYIVFDKVWDTSAFYLAGLFHDVGVIVLASEYPDYMDFYLKNEFKPISMLATEKGTYNVSHAAIGVLLAKKWGMPNEICNAIYLHHHVYGIYKNKVDHETLTITEVLKLAHSLNRQFESAGENEDTPECDLMYLNSSQELLLEPEQIELIKKDIKDIII